MKYIISQATDINNRGFGKPNEDLIYIDHAHGLFVVLDGITRVHDEYDGSSFSAACEVNRIFIETLSSEAAQLDHVHSKQELEQALRRLALSANAALIPYRNSKPLAVWQYYPGTVGILAAIWEHQLCCIWAGDCIGLHLRGTQRHIIADQQTNRAKEQGFSKTQLYAEVCNHPEHECAYGIFNGDSEVERLLSCSWTDLDAGDVVLLSTDGLAAYLQHEPVDRILAVSPKQMLADSQHYDRPPLGKYADDKAILRIDIQA